MVERYRRGRRKQKLLGNHQKCWIWGRNSVLETLWAGRWPIHELRLADTLGDEELSAAQDSGHALNVPVIVESSESLARRCRSREHQGYLAKMTPYPYADASEVLGRRRGSAFFVVLDRVQDPYNFGAIIRSAHVLGADAVFVAKRQQAEVTSLVARTSAGAVNHVDVCQLDDLVQFTNELGSHGIHTVAASEKSARPVYECDFRQSTALIVGNEGRGIADDLLAACDALVAIPQCGRVACLNVAVSAGILLYEVRRQRLPLNDPARPDCSSYRSAAKWSLEKHEVKDG